MDFTLPIEKPKYKPMDVFTDREGICGQCGSFTSRYNAHREKQHAIIYIHGMAGIGKTTLIEKLMLELIEKKNPNIIYYKLNKDRVTDPDKEKEKLLMDMACHILSIKPRQNMDRFLYAYGKLQNPSDPVGAVMEAMEKIKARGDSIFGLGTAIVSDLLKKGGNTFSVMAGIIKKSFITAKWKKVKKEFDGLDEDKLKERLDQYFYEDTKDYFAELKLPYVIFLDDFERYLRPGGEIGEESKKNWLMQFMHAFPNVIWTVAGRDPVEWDKIYNRDDRLFPIEIDLKEFDKKDLVRDFFDKYSDKYGAPRLASEMIDHIWKLTSGFPLYLRLCLDNYDISADKEHMTEDDFGKDLQELLERFYNNYSKQQQNAMLILCCLPDNWSEKLAFRLYDMIENKDRYGLHLDKGLLDELTDTSAFTCEQGVYRIHEVVRKSVIKTAKGFDDKDRLMLILDAQDSYAREYEQNDFWENASIYRENICFCLDEWSETHEGADEDIVQANLKCADDYLIATSYSDNKEPEKAVGHINRAIEVLERKYDKTDWVVLQAKRELISAKITCRLFGRNDLTILDEEIDSLIEECLDAVRIHHKDEWKESLEYLSDIWKEWFQTEGKLISYIESILDEHSDNMDDDISAISAEVRKWRMNQALLDDPENMETSDYEGEDLEAIYADETEYAENELKWFDSISEYKSDEYTEADLDRIDTLIGLLGHLYRTDEMMMVSEKLYQVLKSLNNGKDSKDTVRVLTTASSWISDPVLDSFDDYIEYKKRIWNILRTQEDWTSECAPGKALYEIIELLEGKDRVEEALQYYKELSQVYHLYRDELEISEEEINNRIETLERLVN